VTAVGGVDKLAPPSCAQAMATHERAHPVAPSTQALVVQGSTESARAVGGATGSKNGLQLHCLRAQRRCTLSAPVRPMQPRAADLKDPAELADVGLVRTMGEQLLHHLISRANKADAFLAVRCPT